MFEMLKIREIKKINRQELKLQRRQQQMYLEWKKVNFQDKNIKDFYVKMDSILPIYFGGKNVIKNEVSKRAERYKLENAQLKMDKTKTTDDYFTKVKSFAYKTLNKNLKETMPNLELFYPESLSNCFVKLSWYIFYRELLEKSPQFIQKQILLKQKKNKLFTRKMKRYLKRKYKIWLSEEDERQITTSNIEFIKKFFREDFPKEPKVYMKMWLNKIIIPLLFAGCALILYFLVKTLP